MVLVEAMAEGCVPVVSHLPGITDAVVDDGVNGFLFPVGQVDAMVDKLGRLASDPAAWARMSAAAHGLARQRYSYEAMGRAYMHIMTEARAGRLQPRLSRRLLIPVNPTFLYSWAHLVPEFIRTFVRARRRAWVGARES